MPLFDIKDKNILNQLAEKSKRFNKAEENTANKKGGSLITRIQNICSLVQSKLGHYKDQLELIRSRERLHEYIDSCIKNGIIAIDTETTGLDPFTVKLVGVCIYTRDEKPAYIPINHISYITNTRLKDQLVEQDIKEEFQRLIDSKVKCIWFNAKFDFRILRHTVGVDMPIDHCGFIAAKCLKNNEEEANLKYLWVKYCAENKDEPTMTFDKFFKGLNFALVPIDTAYLYAAKDALMTLDLYDFQIQYLDETNENCINADLTRVAKLYKEIELPIIPIVAEIEDTGVCIDTDYANKLLVEYNAKLQEAEDKFQEALIEYQPQIDEYMASNPKHKLSTPINISSPTQLAELFYDALKLPPVSKKQPRGTGEDVLEQLNHPLGKLILDYRGVAKLINTYIEKMPKIVNPVTHRVHCSYNQYGADTGRFSCLARGSAISTPSGNRNIEDIKPGDFVYSYSDEGELQLNKVKNTWYTGKKKCVKLYWNAGYNKSIKGTLICTPEHCLKTYNGWKQAQDLTPKDSIYYLRRTLGKSSDYVLLSYSFRKQAYREHVWMKENYFNCFDSTLEVHHKDSNKLNNNPDNLQLLTIAEHINIHRQMKNGYCGAYDFTKEQVIKICEEVGWDIHKVKYDYETLKSWLKHHKINYIKEYSDCYDTRPTTMRASGKSFKYKSLPLIEENLKYALELANNNIDEAASYFGKNSSKFVKACHKYKLLPNHSVYKIEFLDEEYDVYDLEIENAHNFIANELCVHNSSDPNLQNIPSHNKDIRKMFVAATEKTLTLQENTFNLLWGDIVPTINGEKDAQTLQVNDILVCDDGNYTIIDISIEDETFYNVRVQRA